MAMIVYKYGCPAKADLDEVGMDQLRLAQQLRNDLVQIEREYADYVAATWETHPEVAAAAERAQTAFDAVGEVVQEMKEHHKADRTTKPRPDDKAALADARATWRSAKADLKVCKDAARDALGPTFKAGVDVKRAAVKATYALYAQDRGLHWASYTEVVRHHQTAAKMVGQKRKLGQRAELRFGRYTGAGTLAVQIMWQAGKPVCTPELFRDPKRYTEATLSGRGRHRTLTVRLSGKRTITLPLVYHREIPADAEIKMVKITRRRIASKHRITVAIVCRIPDPEPRTSGATITVTPSWAGIGEGWLRVAYVDSDRDLTTPPAEIAPLIRLMGRHAEVAYDPQWHEVLERDDGIRSYRDRQIEDLRPKVAAALKGDENLAELVEATAADVTRWRSPRNFAMLAIRWRERAPEHELAPDIEAWRKRDAHLWEYESHERDQVIARRRDAYRKVAAWLCGPGTMKLNLGDLDLAGIRRTTDISKEDTFAARRGRAQMQTAAPGELRELIAVAASLRGIEVAKGAAESEEDVERDASAEAS